MTNREWLNKMPLVDMLSLLNKADAPCIFERLGGENVPDRCNKFNDDEKSIDDCCYNCLCSWLNEDFQKNF